LEADWVLEGTHITAVGADGPGKQELDPAILVRAGEVVVDSISQCSHYGELAHALGAGVLSADRVLELGGVLAQGQRVRNDCDPQQITVADLTGVAVQDAYVAWSVMQSMTRRHDGGPCP
jgi:ornithine cyclodeaminase